MGLLSACVAAHAYHPLTTHRCPPSTRHLSYVAFRPFGALTPGGVGGETPVDAGSNFPDNKNVQENSVEPPAVVDADDRR